MSEQSDTRLFFLDVALFENGAVIRGGALITDLETKPYEFRCTSPVRPSSMQRVLYGDTLEEHIYAELIGVPLVKAAKEKPSLILVRNVSLLRVRPQISYPAILIRRDQKSAVVTDVTNESELKLVTFTAHRDFLAEASSAQAMLSSLMQRRDLLEPFERLQTALVEIHKQKVGDSQKGDASV